ncbi:chemotaxis-specific protein-glutamate methyltransferase CheB [Microvirga lotononidis]|uniref:Protein-glutamate methylesterase/protein-glutamine glutaminase n=1 Tax=Microvirga lotononidis TaxID=864069 RepID=I4YT23_9HYPH|nr:chemotaxis-specific protein-glutamate methyltransferase CheB [Microvirga lotononidis]EIM27115.1 chemotaxis response regulator containing a CheY-like receiver domain and a methylesterase domain [Microvirga lotononidis]WQO28697.1 chemotaxis-specific protein-glutamate methyltransferase CheB [Microvirga lotononidis]
MSMASQPRVRVMVVEDSLVVRQLLVHIIASDPRLVVAAAVSSAEEALQEIGRVQPDVVSMDIRLPGMDGLEATRRIMSEHPTPIVVIADSIEDSSLKISMNALRAGALTVVEKPVGLSSANYAGIASTICTQLYIMSQVPVVRQRSFAPWRERTTIAPPRRDPEWSAARPSIMGIAASTGGPPALAKVLGALPADFSLPVLLVQHMGAPFMEGFASWLNGLVPLKVRLAQDQEIPAAGHVYVAPGDRHLLLSPAGTLKVSAEPHLGNQRPSATMLFQSMARSVGRRGLGVILTGMGEDGAQGLVELRQAGGYGLGEDESTAVVYGMPAAASRMGGVNVSLPLDLIGPRILRLARGEGE